MLYQWYELSHAAIKPARAAAGSCRMLFDHPLNPMTHTPAGKHAVAACEVFERATRRYIKPEFGIETTTVDGQDVAVSEDVVWHKPFCRLIHFRRNLSDARRKQDPRILLVAPMSGHYATLLRGTVETLLPDHEVFITDWQDARNIPFSAGPFDLDDYIDYLIAMMRHFDGDAHVMAVCQPAVPVMAAIARMEAEGDGTVPRSVVLAGGPIDTRVSPTVVNNLAEERGTDWFRSNVITSVPWPSLGAGRPVYPGFLQLTGFMTMNLDRHVNAHKDLFQHMVEGDGDSAEKHRTFYDEYLAVMDLTAEFYLQTIDTVFVRHALAKGEMMHREKRVDLSAIKNVALMTVEGEKDDITGLGQCRAALDLTPALPAGKKYHYECPGVGHYGIFNGSRFRCEIAPRIAQFVRGHDVRARLIPRMPRITSTRERGPGKVCEISSLAFTFAPANDAAPDRMAQRLGARQHPETQENSDADATGASTVTSPLLQWWLVAGQMMIDGLFPRLTNTPATSQRDETRRSRLGN